MEQSKKDEVEEKQTEPLNEGAQETVEKADLPPSKGPVEAESQPEVKMTTADVAEKVQDTMNKTLDPSLASSLVAEKGDHAVQSNMSKTEPNENKVSEKQDALEKAYFESVTGQGDGQQKDEAKAEAAMPNPEEKPAPTEKAPVE